MKMILVLLSMLIMMSQISHGMILNPTFEGEVVSFDQKSVLLKAGFYHVKVMRAAVGTDKISNGQKIKVRLEPGTLQNIQKQMVVTYDIKTK